MSNPSEQPTPEPPTETDPAFVLLQQYLNDLHAGRRPDKDELLARHPKLASMLDCLDELDRIAAPAAPAGEPATVLLADQACGPAPTAPPPATIFGKYRLEGELGRGGMGVVFKATQVDLGRAVALKMILAGHLASADHLSRFQDEAKAAAGLSHPHIVTVYEAGHVDGQPYFAMQYVAGSSLSKWLKDGRRSYESAAGILLSVARAVQHLHENGVVHRDLKPGNILIDAAGHPFVTDFGLVKMLASDSHRTSTGAIVGTPSYMAPEQASAKSDRVGPLSDVYSLGAILYEALAGRPPFQEESPLDTLVQVLEGEPVPPHEIRSDVPRELELIALRCLEKEPAHRFPSARELADALDAYLKGEESSVTLPGVRYRVRRWARREPALVARLVTIALCVLIAQINYHITHVEFALHAKVLGALAAWGAVSVACQRLMHAPRWSEVARYVWAGADVALFTLIMFVADDVLTPVVVGFPLMVAASGLWFRVPLVWYTAALCVASYLTLLAESVARKGLPEGVHKHVIFVLAMVVLAFITAYQVHRVRALSKYYEHRPLP